MERLRFMLLAMLCVAWDCNATDGVVGPGNCDEAGFASVLATVDASGGGTITFDCGTAPTTIPFTSFKTIANAVTIDGGNRIIFDGAGASAFLMIEASADVLLEHLTLQHGIFNGSHALENVGDLSLFDVEVLTNVSTESPIVNYGHFQASSSTFANNAANDLVNGLGGAIANYNDAENDGLAGIVQISFSTFSGNYAVEGGAIFADAPGTFVSDTSFIDNAARNDGGAVEIINGGEVLLQRNSFVNNQAIEADGGALWLQHPSFLEISDYFVGNMAGGSGGALSCNSEFDPTTVDQSTFANNSAQANGGAVASQCDIVFRDDTLVDNTAGGGGGAIYQSGVIDASVNFATIDGNTAQYGGGLYNDPANSGVMHVGNSIVGGNTGDNCDGVLASAGFNLSDDATCGSAFTGPGDENGVALPMEPLGNYGGPTLTTPPATGNPAINHVPLGDCHPGIVPPQDERGALRPAGPACDSGAVEVNGIIDLIFLGWMEWGG